MSVIVPNSTLTTINKQIPVRSAPSDDQGIVTFTISEGQIISQVQQEEDWILIMELNGRVEWVMLKVRLLETRNPYKKPQILAVADNRNCFLCPSSPAKFVQQTLIRVPN